MRPERKHITGSFYVLWDNSDAFETYQVSNVNDEVIGPSEEGCSVTSLILNKAAPYNPGITYLNYGGGALGPYAMNTNPVDQFQAVVTDFRPQAATYNSQYFDGTQFGIPRLPSPGIREGKEMRMWNFTMRMRVRCPIIGPGNGDSAGTYLANPSIGRQYVAIVLVTQIPYWDQTQIDSTPGGFADELQFEDLFEPNRKPTAVGDPTADPSTNAGLNDVGAHNVYGPYLGYSERWHYGRRRRGLGRLQETQLANPNGAMGVPAVQALSTPRYTKKIRVLWQKKIQWKPVVSTDTNLDPQEALGYGITGESRQERNIGVKLRFKGRKVIWSDVQGIPFTGANPSSGGPVWPFGNTRAVDSRPTINQLRLVYWDNYRIVYPQQEGTTDSNKPRLLEDPNGPRFCFDYDLGLTDN